MAVCDFCSSPNVQWAYPTEGFVMPLIGPVDWESVGGWAACPECHKLIENHKRDELVERAIARIPLANYEEWMRPQLTAALRELHNTFWLNRKGPAIPTTPDAPDPT